MLLITIFVELRVVAGRSRTRAGSPQAVSQRSCCAVASRRTAWSEYDMGAKWAMHGKRESDTAALCRSNGKETFQTLSGMAWQGNSMGMRCHYLRLPHYGQQRKIVRVFFMHSLKL